MSKFLMTYRHKGGRYSVAIPAENWADAEDRVRAIAQSGRIEGSDVIEVPANALTFPFASLFVRLFVRRKNLR